MLPDFPKIKKKHVEAINKLLKGELQDPLFSGIREEHHFEGTGMSYKKKERGARSLILLF